MCLRRSLLKSKVWFSYLKCLYIHGLLFFSGSHDTEIVPDKMKTKYLDVSDEMERGDTVIT